jgi:hypothetical protein
MRGLPVSLLEIFKHSLFSGNFAGFSQNRHLYFPFGTFELRAVVAKKQAGQKMTDSKVL